MTEQQLIEAHRGHGGGGLVLWDGQWIDCGGCDWEGTAPENLETQER